VKASELIGCIGSLMGLLVTLPLWLYLVHYLLSAANAPVGVWAAFWVYVVATATTHIVIGVMRMAEQKERGEVAP
jgi:hypothetical protein